MSHQFYFSPHILDNLHPPRSGFDVVQDIAEPRLRMYITARGVKTFFTRKRVHGKDVRIIIGKYPDMDIARARDKMERILAVAKAPRKIRRKKITFGDLSAAFVSAKIRRAPASTAKLKRAMLRLWASLMPEYIDKIPLSKLMQTHEKIAKESGVPTANRMREVMSGIFKYATEQGYMTGNPMTDVPRYKEARTARTLTAAGLRRLHTACSAEKNPTFRDAFLMLFYGFAGKSKIFSMRWSDLDLNQETWKKEPLSDYAVKLLREMPEDGKWVFPHWGGHLVDPRAAWKRLVERAKTPGVKMDDVHKFLSRRLEWSADKYIRRRNMNDVLAECLQDRIAR
ncbi:MAG: integrase family protein [Alphaproteobacteria bacterium]|nr:integrase family protein [Alphaproteobacteria bacterium]MCL2758562.1 integrase family protein [Alphaproteobacteria bacterium]